MALSLTLLALLIDVAVGYPARVFRTIGHPVTWMGWLIGRLDRHFNRDDASFGERRRRGVVALALLIAAVALPTLAIEAVLGGSAVAIALLAVFASSLLAQRSLYEHVARVAAALERDGIGAGRAAVSHIVGRDTEHLDEPAVARAALETLAESFGDGVVAPAVWLAMLGLPGAAVYKAVNTADSMIGHKSERHLAFGWAAARFDDLVNLPASRLAALLIAAAAALLPGLSGRGAWAAVRSDARGHESPNAGWPEAALAGALGVALGGTRAYDGVEILLPAMNRGGRSALTAADIRAGLRLVVVADALLIGLVAGLAALL
ncbi:adenosylcobinamide-phosphate synthase CbiB [Chelatococcus reniformis]|uniref:Cobalamin biosynthesis protein CobD n=1 Tax=Chelatococcus reniformis TaxID=1494448 RepID=A0A916UWX9_9HYPH|nr:adenosylcobinamide-phosphate synthase CbiB [Chelatococcus reniformis]GGC92523.1 cobalamin biosynthesis protein CobD [Chelatococcus reniformis]